jgi:succinoglycan biosynthesis transport protein ExoP
MIERINYLGALRRGWRLLVALAILFAVIAVLLPMPTTKVHKPPVNKYPWRAPAYLAAIPANGIGPAGVSTQTILFWADNYYTKQTAIQAAGQIKSAAELQPLMKGSAVGLAAVSGKGAATARTTATTTASAKTGSEYVRLLAGGATQDQAVALANNYATAVLYAVNQAFAANRKNLTPAQQQANPNAKSDLVIVAPAVTSRAKILAVKVKPKPTKLGHKELGLIGLAAGLLVGALIILARELLNKSLQTAEGAEAAFQYPVVVEIPERPRKGVGATSGPLTVVDEPMSPAAEAYRMLRVSVLFEGLAEAPPLYDPYESFGDAAPSGRLAAREPYKAPEPGTRQVVLVVSAGREKSRPALAANLAAVYAEAGERVIVISTADIDSGYPAGPVVGGSEQYEPWQLAPHMEPSNLENVSRLSLRPFVASSAQLATRAPAILDAARQLADVVIVEAPPLLAVHHGEALARAVDVVVVVAECRSTTINQAQRAGEILRRMGARVLGVALTEVRLSSRDIRQASWLIDPESTPALETANVNQLPEATRT